MAEGKESAFVFGKYRTSKQPLCDLHVHTVASDGTDTPEKVVSRAEKIGLKAIAITDHDAVEGILPAVKAASARLTLVPGVEISTEESNREIHILGYFINYNHPRLLELLSLLRRRRRDRAVQIVERLKKMGIAIDFEMVENLAGVGAIGRPHIARILAEIGAVPSAEAAFSHLIGRGCPAYVPRAKFTAVDAIRLIKEVGGVAVLAHPGVSQGEEVLGQLVSAGLSGIEVEYPEHTAGQREHFRKLAQRYGLIATGGSDYHGPDSRFPLGAAVVPFSVVQELQAAAR